MKKILLLIFDALSSAVALFVFPAIMIWVTWGMADNWISYSWIIVLVSVLIAEILSKIFTDDTLSSNIREEVIEAKKKEKKWWRIWIMLIAWLLFSVQLFFHFIKPLVMGV